VPVITNTAEIRRQNRSRIYKFIYETGGKTCKKEIADSLFLSLPTVSQNLQEMFDEGLICYSGTKASTGGRKARTISINESAGYAVGISITDDEVSFTAVDLKAQEIANTAVQMRFSDSNAYFCNVNNCLVSFLKTIPGDADKLIGVAITLPGIVNPQTQMLEFAPTLGIRNKEISGISECFSYPVQIFNDADARGYAEFWKHNQENMAYLSISRGVGGAIFCAGKCYYGDHFRSGEFGHICVHNNGRMCDCGKKGCLEAYCSTQRISDDFHMELKEFFRCMSEGNQKMILFWSDYLEHLAIGIATIRNVLDCQIVLGGSVSDYMSPYMAELREKVLQHSPFDEDTDFLKLGNCNASSACYGAALYNITEYIEGV